MNKYYLTTPIYYTNAAPHIGHAYTTIAADAIKRMKKMQGFDAVLTTGTDEHGVNVERAAEAMGKPPKEYCDIIAEEFRNQWKILGLAVDRFERTTSDRHAAVVQDLFHRCRDRGFVYKGSYTGQYCIFDNLFVEAKPGDPCPECGRPTETVTEENYFFKLSAFTDKLLDFYQQNPDWIQPETRKNEVIAFVKQGLRDLSITRTSVKWGIPVPDDPKHVFYVWFDALTTYMSAVQGENYWPADLHLIGKEIVRFHAVYWPAFLMAADLPLPKKIFAHGWLLFDNEKISKSKGKLVRATPIQKVLGTDALRYFLLREVVFGQDGNFSYDALVGRYNSDLANGLGNLASRTLTMIHQYRGGAVPKSEGLSQIAEAATQAVSIALDCFEKLEFSRALETIWGLIAAVDKFIVERAPWKLAKAEDAESQRLLDETLYTAAEALRIVTAILYPIIPESTSKIWSQLGYTHPLAEIRTKDLHWGKLEGGQLLGAVSGVFPRADKALIEKMQELEEQEFARQQALLGKAPAPVASADPKISIDDFLKVEMRVGVVLDAASVKGSDKLLHLHVDIGEAKPRSIVAGIAGAYDPTKIVGRKVAIVANLQPRKLKGLESQGMIVAASLEGGSPSLVSFLEEVPIGARLK